MDIFTMVGLAGVAAYVAAYALLQVRVLDGNGVTYSVLNVVAAACVLISLTSDFNLASAVIQVVWISFGLIGLGMRFARSRTRRESRLNAVSAEQLALSPLPLEGMRERLATAASNQRISA